MAQAFSHAHIMFPGPAPGSPPAPALEFKPILRFLPDDLLDMPAEDFYWQRTRLAAWYAEIKRDYAFVQARLATLQRDIERRHAVHAHWILAAAKAGTPEPAQLHQLRMHTMFEVRNTLEEMCALGARIDKLAMDSLALNFLGGLFVDDQQAALRELAAPANLNYLYLDGGVCMAFVHEYANLRMLKCTPEKIAQIFSLPASQARLRELQVLYRANLRADFFHAQEAGGKYPQHTWRQIDLAYHREVGLGLLGRDLPDLPNMHRRDALLARLPTPRVNKYASAGLTLGATMALWEKARPDTKDRQLSWIASQPRFRDRAEEWRKTMAHILHQEAAASRGGVLAVNYKNRLKQGHVSLVDTSALPIVFADANYGLIRLPHDGLDSDLLHFLLARFQIVSGQNFCAVYALAGLDEPTPGGVRWHHAPGDAKFNGRKR